MYLKVKIKEKVLFLNRCLKGALQKICILYKQQRTKSFLIGFCLSGIKYMYPSIYRIFYSYARSFVAFSIWKTFFFYIFIKVKKSNNKNWGWEKKFKSHCRKSFEFFSLIVWTCCHQNHINAIRTCLDGYNTLYIQLLLLIIMRKIIFSDTFFSIIISFSCIWWSNKRKKIG